MANFKVLAAATCLLVSVMVVRAMPGGHAESYLESNLESHGSQGLRLGGHGSQGISLGGHGIQGLSLGGHGSQGLSLGGHGSQGLSLGGHGSQGLSLGGHGLSLGGQGLSLGGHGLSLGGHGLSGGISLGGQGGGHGHQEIYADHHPRYNFRYGVEDHHTGDHHQQQEERDGDVVHGEYSLLQPDGRRRIVHYTASHHGGFNAHVSYSGHAIHPEVHQSHQLH